MDLSPEVELDDGRNVYDYSTQSQPSDLSEFVTYKYVDVGSSSPSPMAPVVSNVSIRCISEHVPSMREYFTDK
ncbi:hypothetical protein M8J77_019850 [Diaphorina citri]|nr:hypothetical protein M8J77_019850 [Diaphorina citri]